MTPSEELILKLMAEEIEALEPVHPTAAFGTRASVRVGKRVGLDPRLVHRLWLRTQFT